MKKHKILIIDDHVFEAEAELALPLKALEDVEVLDIVSSYEEAIVAIERDLPSLAICDVQLRPEDSSNADGILVAKRLEELGIPFFLVTAYPRTYFETHVLPFKPRYFFHKPLKPEYLSNMVRLVLKEIDIKERESEQGQLIYNRANDWFIIGKRGGLKVPSKEVVYFQGEGNYTWIFILKNGSELEKLPSNLSISIGDVENVVKPLSKFLRVSKSIIINTLYVDRYENKSRRFFLNGGAKKGQEVIFPVSANYWDHFLFAMRGK